MSEFSAASCWEETLHKDAGLRSCIKGREKTQTHASVVVSIITVALQILVRQRQDCEIPESLSQIQLSYLLVGWQVNLSFEVFPWNLILDWLSLFTISFPVSFLCLFTFLSPGSAPHLFIATVYLIFPKQNRVFSMSPTVLNTQFLAAGKCSNVTL